METGKVILYLFGAICIMLGVGLIAGGRTIAPLIGAGLAFIISGIALIVVTIYLPIKDSS